MRRNVRRRQTKTRSLQRSVQVLLILSGIAFLLAGLVLAASGASITSAFGAVDDRMGGSDQSADDGSTGESAGGNESTGANESGGDGAGSGSGQNGGDDSGDTGNETAGSGGDGTGGEDDGDGTTEVETHVLTTVVETQTGQPVTNATVTLDSGADSSQQRSVDDTGAAEFDRENGQYTVTATADGYETTERTVQIDGADRTVTLTLTERSDSGGGDNGGDSDDGTHSLAVSVASENGSPITNATVELRDESGLFASSETKTVGGNGTAVFERENGGYTIVATADGYETTRRTVQLDGSDQTVTLLLESRDG
ncbi:carboxypeptidase regulatory-like domain-containing protein [Natrinema marinum]|uniref:carboxypeptidase regulatory-like domain-containing protein n=1 Tax=Natrinema marinum TaxID=2961598 RepID=UPI0020C89A50|nr:carboxypeptidase regulatory-like domain-containing protein [Natrinema marinum]